MGIIPTKACQSMNPQQSFLIFTAILIIGWLIGDSLGTTTIDTIWLIVGLFVTLFFSEKYVEYELRMETPKLIATNFHTTTDGNFIVAGNYAIFTMGDINHHLHIKGRDGTLVVPRDSINPLGKHKALCVVPYIVPIDRLDQTVQAKIKENDLPEPYWLGILSDSQLVEPKNDRVFKEITEQNGIISMLSDLINGKFGSIEQAIEFSGRITKDKNSGNWLKERLSRKAREDAQD